MAILDDTTLDFISTSPEQTVRLGVRLGELIMAGDLLCLSGELGSGKTTLAQGIGRGWGAVGRVTSPTFILVNEYPRYRDRQVLYHIDCYRLETAGEVLTAGIDEILDSESVIMIEWPEHIEHLLPPHKLWLDLRYINETRRGLQIKAFGDRPLLLLQKFRQNAFGV